MKGQWKFQGVGGLNSRGVGDSNQKVFHGRGMDIFWNLHIWKKNYNKNMTPLVHANVLVKLCNKYMINMQMHINHNLVMNIFLFGGGGEDGWMLIPLEILGRGHTQWNKNPGGTGDEVWIFCGTLQFNFD